MNRESDAGIQSDSKRGSFAATDSMASKEAADAAWVRIWTLASGGTLRTHKSEFPVGFKA